jgi:hypothetical protein
MPQGRSAGIETGAKKMTGVLCLIAVGTSRGWVAITRRIHVWSVRTDGLFERPEGEGLAGILKKLHNDELSNFFSLRNTARAIKSRWVGCMRHVVRVWESENVKGKGRLGDPVVDRRIILKLSKRNDL